MQYGKTDCYDLYFFYDDNDQPLGFYYRDVFTSGRGRKFYFVLNAQGDVVQLRDSQNRTVANYHYDAWGKLLSITDPDGTVLTASGDDYYPTNAQIAFINPIRYRGYVYDNETGFYYLNTRYYDPSLRRFVNVDAYVSTGQGLLGYNMFVYVYNNPVRYSDHDGMLPDDQLLERARMYNNGGYVGMCGGRKKSSQSKELLSADSFHNKDGSYSLYDNDRVVDRNSWHEQVIVIEPISPPSFDLQSGDIGLGSIGGDIATGGWEYENLDLSLFDFGHVEASAGIKDGQATIGALASVYSPSVTTGFWGIKVEVSAEILSVGAGFSIGRNGVSVAGALGFGGSIQVYWD